MEIFELLGALIRYWWRLVPLARREIDYWRGRAELIDDDTLRSIALAKIDGERKNVESAAFFAVLAPDWSRAVRRIVAFQLAYEYLDGLSERWPGDSTTLHGALVEAVGGDRCEHGGGVYLQELVDTCRRLTRTSPVMVAAVTDVGDAQTSNHQGDDLSGRHGRFARALPWWEAAAAGISSLDILAMLVTPTDLHHRIGRAYVEICALSALLDGLVDHASDEPSNHNWLEHYESREAMTDRLLTLVGDSQEALVGLPGERVHRLILAGLVAHNLAVPAASIEPAITRTLTRSVRFAGPAVLMLRVVHIVLRS